MRPAELAAVLALVAALQACASERRQEQRAAEWQQLVQLRGQTLTALQTHHVGRGEAIFLEGQLDSGRRELDRQDTGDAQVRLDAVGVYLKGRTP